MFTLDGLYEKSAGGFGALVIHENYYVRSMSC